MDNSDESIRLPILLKDGTNAEFKLRYIEIEKEAFYVVEIGEINEDCLVRIHSACNLAHIFGSLRCDCKEQLDDALLIMARNGSGLLIYCINHEGRAVGPRNHVQVYKMQDKGLDTVESYTALGLPIDARDYSKAIQIIKRYGLNKIKLLTNNPKKIESFNNSNIRVERIPLIAHLSKYNESQLKIKKTKLGHLL